MNAVGSGWLRSVSHVPRLGRASARSSGVCATVSVITPRRCSGVARLGLAPVVEVEIKSAPTAAARHPAGLSGILRCVPVFPVRYTVRRRMSHALPVSGGEPHQAQCLGPPAGLLGWRRAVPSTWSTSTVISLRNCGQEVLGKVDPAHAICHVPDPRN